MKALNQTLLKKNNQRTIADYIIQNGPMSRAGLAKKLRVSKPTISANVAELINMQLLSEIGHGQSDIGKKPILLDFNKDFSYVLALDFISYITSNKISVAVCNLFCEPLFMETILLPARFDAATVKRLVWPSLSALLKQYSIPMEKIARVVITAPTVWFDDTHVDFICRNGEVINLCELLKPYFRGKIIVENDINLAALGERYFGTGREVSTLFFAWIGINVGGGIILNGSLYAGKGNNGGEIAYSTVYNESMSRYEYFRDMTDMPGIRRYICQNHIKALSSSLCAQFADDSFTLDDMITAANNGDVFCIGFAKHIGKIAAIVLSSLASTIDLEMVIVGGDYARFGNIFLDEIKEMIKDIPTTKAVVTTPMYTNSAMYGSFKFGVERIIPHLIK